LCAVKISLNVQKNLNDTSKNHSIDRFNLDNSESEWQRSNYSLYIF